MKLLEFCNTYLLGVAVPLCLLLEGLFFLLRLRAFPFLHPLRFARTAMKRSKRGGISPMRALSLALAGVLGVGNLVGVSAALAAGGAGAGQGCSGVLLGSHPVLGEMVCNISGHCSGDACSTPKL